jgi:SAM-dependent methyltransferase
MLTVDFHRLKIAPGSRILDAGCGTGRHLFEAYRFEGSQVVGVDLNWEDLRKARYTLYTMGEANRGSWAVSRADATRLPFRDESFDLVICSEVLEHVPDNRAAVAELVRVLKPGKDLVVSVPRYLPERICWALSESYHNEPGGHIRIYRRKEIKGLLESAGLRCWGIHYKHALHAPYWWLKCLVGHKNESNGFVNLYKRFLEWDIIEHPPLTRGLERMLNPLIAKSLVLYLRKGCE